MVDNNGNIEDIDIEEIGIIINNNGLNISNSIYKLTKELRIHNILKIIELGLSKGYGINYKGLSKEAKETLEKYLEE